MLFVNAASCLVDSACQTTMSESSEVHFKMLLLRKRLQSVVWIIIQFTGLSDMVKHHCKCLTAALVTLMDYICFCNAINCQTIENWLRREQQPSQSAD